MFLFIFVGAIQCSFLKGAFKSWTCRHDRAHSCSLRIDFFGLRLSGSCSGAECKSCQTSRRWFQSPNLGLFYFDASALLSSRAFWVPPLWSSSYHPHASSNSPLAAGFRAKTWYLPSWYLLACLSWSPVWSWPASTHKTVRMEWRCSTAWNQTSLALYHLYEENSDHIFNSISFYLNGADILW